VALRQKQLVRRRRLSRRGSNDIEQQAAGTQWGLGFPDESSRLPARYAEAVVLMANNDNRVDQHDRQQNDIGLIKPTRRGR
jgi:hypothetical protein